ncbi:MAG: helix-turn-helix domain-containing protein [Hyphomicrobiales bacterium]|nr:helix-turn-helix domain-containing protein [Hyphomicrobiales bacterium]
MMSAAIRIREDYCAEELRVLARVSKDRGQTRRLMSLAAVMEGKSRLESAAIGLMDRQTLQDWVIRFNGDGPDGLIEHKSAGRKPKLSDEQKSRLAQHVEEGPGDHVPGLIRWRCVDLASLVRQRFNVDFHPATIACILHKLYYSHISARPHCSNGSVVCL